MAPHRRSPGCSVGLNAIRPRDHWPSPSARTQSDRETRRISSCKKQASTRICLARPRSSTSSSATTMRTRRSRLIFGLATTSYALIYARPAAGAADWDDEVLDAAAFSGDEVQDILEDEEAGWRHDAEIEEKEVTGSLRSTGPDDEEVGEGEDGEYEADEDKTEDTSSEAKDKADDDDPESVYERGLYPKDPDFIKQVNCDFTRPEWQQYRHVYEIALNREDSDPPDFKALTESTRILSSVLWARARNVTDILTCNVGIIAGYQRLSHALLIAGLGPKTALYRYRLLQLALIFIFTLRNANKIPGNAGEYWAASEQYIIPNIMAIRRHVENVELRRRKEREWFTGRTVANHFRDPNMRIAIVSICAYPPTSDIALKDVTPLNREVYARRHGYALRLHTEPPLLGGNVQIQHAKLATVNHYIRSGDFDWVVWFDCDSLIMNLDHTIDSVIYRAAGQWSSNNFAGEWADTWDPQTIVIKVHEKEVTATAPQFGTATGHMEGKTLVMEFDNAVEPIEGTLENTEEGDIIQWSNGAVWHRTRSVTPCESPETCPELKGLDDSIDLLITEEGWGLSSANWMVRRSPWTVSFLDQALDVAHVKIPLFGDQDAIIYLVMNDQTLRGLTDALADPNKILESDEELPDPLDSHVRVIPQRELNAYDHLNAYTMDVDGYQFGDLLITFPQCKDASCNSLFRLAAEYAHERDEFAYNPHDWVHVRLFGPRDLVAMWWRRHMEEERGRKEGGEEEGAGDDVGDEGDEKNNGADPAKVAVRPEGGEEEGDTPSGSTGSRSTLAEEMFDEEGEPLEGEGPIADGIGEGEEENEEAEAEVENEETEAYGGSYAEDGEEDDAEGEMPYGEEYVEDAVDEEEQAEL